MTHKILILGGSGYTGKLVARHLLECSDAGVTLAARRLEGVQTLADELNASFPGDRVRAVHADAAQPDSLRLAFAGQSLVVVAAPTTAHTAAVIQAALDAGADYLDVQIGEQKLKLLEQKAAEIQAVGRCFITEAGFHPGLPSALVRYAAARLDVLESAITLGYLNMGKGLPYSEAVDELVEMFKHYSGSVFQNGVWTKPNSYKLRLLDFGGDIGRKHCYPMFFEELRRMPDMFPSLKETGFYMSEMHFLLDYVVMPITWAWLALAPKATRPIGKFIWWGMGTFHRAPYRVELQVQARGRKDGQPASLCARVAHADGYELTAIPVVAALLQYLDGSARKPGLWMMGHLVEPLRLMQDMEKMGLQVSVTQ